ncbi:ZIP family metal transporter [Haladaptatus pallidirubidus]|uniref:ZIP family metal transporter n=1 Tax=Haladaptatus pallidirubidus TaxID=1008152 RepID=UPI0035EE7D33
MGPGTATVAASASSNRRRRSTKGVGSDRCRRSPRRYSGVRRDWAVAAAGENIGLGLVAGFFLSNVPQGLSSASGMKKAGRSSKYIFSLWTGILLISGMAAAAGYLLLGTANSAIPATILAFAAGGVLAMLAESMIPEAFADAQPFTGLITVVGFLVAFLIIRIPA